LTSDLNIQARPSEGPNRCSNLHCEFGANLFSGSEIFDSETNKVTDSAKNKLTQFAACGNNNSNDKMTVSVN